MKKKVRAKVCSPQRKNAGPQRREKGVVGGGGVGKESIVENIGGIQRVREKRKG